MFFVSRLSGWFQCLLSIVLISSLFACEKEGFTPLNEQQQSEKPEIVMLDVSPSPRVLEICGEEDPHSIPLSSTDTFSLKFNIIAANGLSEYKIDIHNNFDCHIHTRGPSTVIPWKVLDIENLDGQDVTVTKKLLVPSNVQAGNYHFILQALDLKGNEAEWILYSLQIKNKDDILPPVVELLVPQTDSISISKSETVLVKMNISDDKALFGGRVDVIYLDPAETEFTADQYFFPENTGSETTYSLSYSFPTTPASGTYTFIIRSYDAVGNETHKKLKVHIEG